MILSDFSSKKFRFWSFVSMFLLVFVHGYNLEVRYMQPWTIPGEPLNFTSFTEYFLANGIFRFRIPMLFIISGFLFALQDQKPYKERIKKRLRTLLLPYLVWSALGILLTYLLEISPVGSSMVRDSHIVQIDDHRMLIHDYHWYETMFKWIFLPVPYQLWFIRVLLIYNLAYPGIRWCVTHPVWRWVFFSVAFLMWMGTMGFVLFEGEGLLFFSLGVWIQKTDFSIDQPSAWFKPRWWLVIFLGVATIKTVLAFIGQPYLGKWIFPVLSILHKITVLSGLIGCWYGLNGVVRWFMARRWFVWLSAFAFMIYATHAPMVAYLIDPALKLLKPLPGSQFLAFLFLPMAIITFAITIGAILRKLLPGVYAFLTGGRGLY
ncbi:MAG: acyltransferase [Bacteroidetes bacterium]|nr:acyltransferase [Bacteroidota bacterium]